MYPSFGLSLRGSLYHLDAINFGDFCFCIPGVLDRRMTSVTFEIGSNNLNTISVAVIDRIMDHSAVCRLTLERGHQYHLCHQAPPSNSRTILSVALEIPSMPGGR